MKDTSYIKDFEGRIIAIIETEANGDQLIRDFASRMVLGFYKARFNHTTNFIGQVIAQGNALTSLITIPKK